MFLEYIPVPVEVMNPPAGVSWWEIVAAIGTILAAVVPGLLWWFERRDRKTAEAKLEQLRTAQVRAERENQARLIVPEVHFIYEDGERVRGFGLFINFSDAPVLDVVFGWHVSSEDPRDILGTIRHQSKVLRPQKEVKIPEFKPVDEYKHNLKAFIKFTDVSQRRWLKWDDGSLELIESPHGDTDKPPAPEKPKK